MKGTDWIVEYLHRHESVSHVFTYAGGTNAWMLDAIRRHPNVDFVAMKHEQNAGFAADGYARASGRLGVVVTMSGPGATNLITGIADAYFDSVPVLFLTCQVTTSTYKFANPVRQLGYQETDILSIAQSITKMASMPLSADALMETIQEAMSAVFAGRPGPVLVDIPSDVQRLECAPVPNAASRSADVKYPTDAEVQAALELIAKSERPLLLLGGGARTAGVAPQVLAFAERLQIPVVVSLLGKDVFPHDHPLFVGFIGSYGNRYANLSLANCDLIVALGSRMDSRQTGNPKTFARAAKVIHVDVDRNELNNTVKATLAVQSHLSGFLESALRVADQVRADSYAPWKKYIEDVTAEFRIEDPQTTLVNPKQFLRRLAAAGRGDEVFTADVGNHQMWAAQELKIQQGQRFLTSGGLGTMGFAIPAAIGAWFACRPRPVVALVGDGGFQMSLPELETVAHNCLPIKIVVFNNNILGLMWHFQKENFAGAGHPATEEGYSCPDIQKLAAAYGIPSRRIADSEEIDDATTWLLHTDGPALLELAVDSSWAGYPKVKPGNPIEGQLPEIEPSRLSKFMLIPELPKS